MVCNSAFQAEEQNESTLVDELVTLLSRVFPHERHLRPLESAVSCWQKDPFAHGSYSYVGLDATGDDYDLLGQPIDKKLFFAGEATCRTHPATVHGAYLSGLRAASQVLESLIGEIEMPSEHPLIPKKNQPTHNPLIEKSTIPEVLQRFDPAFYRFKARNLKGA